MKHFASLRIAVMIIAASGLLPAFASPETPIAEGTEILARVNGEPIMLDAYYRALGELHAESMGSEQSVSGKDPMHLLERLIRVELILQEASAIGLDEQPEFTGAIESFRRDLLQAALFDYAVRDVPPPDPADVQSRFAEKQTQVEVSGVQFEKIEVAETFRDAVGETGDFESLARTYAADGRATDFREREWIWRNDLAPAIVEDLANLETGQITSPVLIGPVFAVVKLYESQLLDDPEVRAEAETEVSNADRSRALRKYIDGLKEKYTRTDTELLDALDFDTGVAGFDELLEDERVLVRVEDEDPIRVRDLAEKLQGGLFHGVEQAAKRKRLDKDKVRALDELTIARVIQQDGERLKLDQTAEFQEQVDDFADSMLFGQFVSRVLDPSVEVRDEDVESYYAEHVDEYTEPGMVRLDSLAFADAETAQRALEHLIAGADMVWMRSNTSGQVDPEADPEELRFDRRLLIESSLAEGVRDAITGAVSGDNRIYAEAEDRFYVIHVVERMPATARSLERVRDEVVRHVYTIQRQKDLEDWMSRVREASEIEMLVDADQLRQLVMGELGSPPDRAESPSVVEVP